jgi:hypothetical protein
MKAENRDYVVNRQIGNYVVYSREANKAPLFVRMAGDETPISTHWNVTDAVKAIRRYIAGDKRRADHLYRTSGGTRVR